MSNIAYVRVSTLEQNESRQIEALEKFNIDRTKQDRIYFFPGRKGIHEGKIIVKHIGKHL